MGIILKLVDTITWLIINLIIRLVLICFTFFPSHHPYLHPFDVKFKRNGNLKKHVNFDHKENFVKCDDKFESSVSLIRLSICIDDFCHLWSMWLHIYCPRNRIYSCWYWEVFWRLKMWCLLLGRMWKKTLVKLC